MRIVRLANGARFGLIRVQVSGRIGPGRSNPLCRFAPDSTGMGQYACGDVLLATVALDDRTAAKTRPVVVIRTGEPGTIRVCPVSSKPPNDAPCLPLTIDDFSTGGLDLFSESYVMTTRVLVLRSADVIGKKGRLTGESLEEITGSVPAIGPDGKKLVKKSGSPRARH